MCKEKVAVVGGGVAGAAMALELSKIGYDVILFEKENFFKRKVQQFVTFNYTINRRGISQLIHYNLWEEVLKQSRPLYGRCVHFSTKSVFENYSYDGDAMLYSISRVDFLSILSAKVAENKKIVIKDESIIDDVFLENDKVRLIASRNNVKDSYLFDFIVGADGSNSLIRKKFNMIFKSSSKEFDWRYIQVGINPEEAKRLNLSCSMINFWQKKNYLGIGIPNVDLSISLLHFFKEPNLDDIKADISNYITSLESLKKLHLEKVGIMRKVDVKKWFLKDNVILIGDAAHSLYPFLAQGMNAALQDGALLGQLLQHHKRSKAFALFQKIRKKELDILKKKSIKHFFALKSSKYFRFKTLMRQFDLHLAKLTHDYWLEEYSALSNSTIRINIIFRRLKLQRIMKLTPVYFIPFFFYCLRRKKVI